MKKLIKSISLILITLPLLAFASPNINQVFKTISTSKTTNTIAGNPNGKITLVEFFDYNCGSCRRMQPVLNQVIKQNKDLKVVYIAFPLFGKSSIPPIKAAIAAERQGKYLAMHDAMMSARSPLDTQEIFKLARKAGINTKELSTGMDSKSVKKQTLDNYLMAYELGIRGTPTFMIGKTGGTPQVQLGAMNKSELEAFINYAK